MNPYIAINTFSIIIYTHSRTTFFFPMALYMLSDIFIQPLRVDKADKIVSISK